MKTPAFTFCRLFASACLLCGSGCNLAIFSDRLCMDDVMTTPRGSATVGCAIRCLWRDHDGQAEATKKLAARLDALERKTRPNAVGNETVNP